MRSQPIERSAALSREAEVLRATARALREDVRVRRGHRAALKRGQGMLCLYSSHYGEPDGTGARMPAVLPPMFTPIPSEERVTLRQSFHEALRLASGDPQSAREHLELGLVWAETPPLDPIGFESGPLEPWAPALVCAYQRALIALNRWIDRWAAMSVRAATARETRREAGALVAAAGRVGEQSRRLREASSAARRDRARPRL